MHKAALITACLFAVSASAQAQGCMADIKKNGLTVGTNPGYPPFESLDSNNQIIGLDPDLVNAIAGKLGVQVNWVNQPFDGLIAALISKKIDLIAAGMTVTPERKKAVNFTLPYDNSENVILARKEHPEYNSAAALNGKSIGVELGTIQEKVAQGIKGANVKTLNQFTDAAIAVQTQQIDSMLIDRVVAERFTKTYPDLRITGVLNKNSKAMAVRRDCGDLLSRIDAAIIQLRKSGELGALRKKWLNK
ncbi:basic amino acid ABC transporter substrate-binding protein [Deinococcus sp.]|uniref:basic amino acid ABC transporter substrate-binding protein n=1 Tax=Deinococcus sp. TaxID=47478 RepID=UPI0025C09B04|nr:basic amino acid ABC transporter substrate-binding protein [Deinococcus sp.]